jgi:hypothetical protein
VLLQGGGAVKHSILNMDIKQLRAVYNKKIQGEAK